MKLPPWATIRSRAAATAASAQASRRGCRGFELERSGRYRSATVAGSRTRCHRRQAVLQCAVGRELDARRQWSAIPSSSRSTTRPPARASSSSESISASVAGRAEARSSLRALPAARRSRRAIRPIRSVCERRPAPSLIGKRQLGALGELDHLAHAHARSHVQVRRQAGALDLNGELGRALALALSSSVCAASRSASDPVTTPHGPRPS